MSLFCYALLCDHSSEEEEKAGCFAIIVLQMYCYNNCSVALPHGAMGWYAVCDCGITYFFFFFPTFTLIITISRPYEMGTLK